MGNKLNGFFKRIFDYPIKRKPICFYRQEDFATTGEPLPKNQTQDKEPKTEYDKLVSSFYERLLAQRRHTKQMEEKNRRYSVQKVMKRFTGWNEMTIANLHSLFLLFDNSQNGMLSLDDFCAVLESLGDESTMEVRKTRFDATDTDNDGWISYDEFLYLVYNFDPPENGEIVGLAKLCFDVAENIRFVSSLSVGEQLEYGLF
ncbi:EF-hand domain-containing protein D1 [Anabrus simplex]|uniref:EF-hand domain-containing protein D1 n=1 Tax=Anabrus simplex TaxID=316456 RepID=UPI0034DD0D70